MKKKRFSVEQIVAVLKQAELGVPVAEVIRKVGISEQTFYRWKKQYVGLETDQARQMKQLQEENSRLKQLVAVTLRTVLTVEPATACTHSLKDRLVLRLSVATESKHPDGFQGNESRE